MNLRILLLPFGVVAELLLLLACWFLAVFSTHNAKVLAAWTIKTFPNRKWYAGEN
ncbi:hypothetical protein [Desulfuromonas sp. AOP6]|uniref:hypothetical protein n=1 Tax=Desulfuromonas sp. AOP6 TaxID=1566351 RepID=UPI0012DDFED4|nr:hypothetical protein [Desulfuromonas sp. AOP6]